MSAKTTSFANNNNNNNNNNNKNEKTNFSVFIPVYEIINKI